jgi:4-amino-4-deoxy-L-arabinose transferase-like glycosyltransferase
VETCNYSTFRDPSEGSHRAAVKQWKFCFWLLIASLALNVVIVTLVRQHETITSIDYDEREYWNLATAFHDFGLSGISPRRTPPFPILIATLRSLVVNDYFAVQIALSALLAMSPVLVFWLVRRQIGSERAAKFASIGFLLWPVFVRFDATLYSDSMALLVFLVYLLSFPLKVTPDDTNISRWMQFCISGGLLSLCMQMKPLYLIYLPFAVVLAISRESTLRRRMYAASILIAGCVIVTLPWSTYISVREGYLIPLSANDGETLAGGLNPVLLNIEKRLYVSSEGRPYSSEAGKWLQMHETGYLSKQELELPYASQAALLKQRVYAWITSHPKETAYLSGRKLLYMWGLYPFWNGAMQSLLGNLPLLLLVCVALLSLWINREAFLELALFWTLPFFSSAVCLISWGSWRFRMPADLGLIVLAATLLAIWWPLLPKVKRLSALRTSLSAVAKMARENGDQDQN